MSDYNSFSFIGRIVAEPEVTPSTASREGYARVRMASSGITEDSVMWITVFFPESVVGRRIQYMTVGRPFVVTGRLSHDSYIDKNNVERQGLTVAATSLDFTPSNRAEGEAGVAATTGRMKTNPARAAVVDDGDDIPF